MKHLFLLLVLVCFVGCTSNKKEDAPDKSNKSDTISENFEEYEDSDAEFPEDPLDETVDEDISAADDEDTYGAEDTEDTYGSMDETDETSEYGSDDFIEEDNSDNQYQDSEESYAQEETENEETQDYSLYNEESEGSDSSFDQTDTAQSYSEESIEGEPKGYVPVKKIRFETFEKASRLINAVYVVREGDTLASISSKIYGDPQRESELLEINTTLARKISVGDKVYYNSPNRPNDRGRLVSYYEDANINSSVYNAKKGENIRDIAENLLGNRESWKELWAKNSELNETEKWTLTQDREIRYWPVGQAPQAPIEMAENTQGPPPDVINEPPPPDMTDGPPPPPDMADIPPPPPGMMDDMGMPPPPPEEIVDNMPPPPPPPAPLPPEMADVPPPPPPPLPPPVEVPPPPSEMADEDGDEGGALGLLEKLPGGGDKVTVLAAGVVLIMVVLLLAVRKKSKSRKKSLEATGFGETQI